MCEFYKNLFCIKIPENKKCQKRYMGLIGLAGNAVRILFSIWKVKALPLPA